MIAFVTPTPVHTISAHKIHFDFHSSNRGATECSPLFTRLERRMKENILCVAWCINHSTPFLSCFLNDALPSAKGQIERKTWFLISTGNFVSSRCSKDPTSTLLPNSKRKNPKQKGNHLWHSHEVEEQEEHERLKFSASVLRVYIQRTATKTDPFPFCYLLSLIHFY